MTTTFTTAPFRRSHAKEPIGFGQWAFQETTKATAFQGEMVGQMFFPPASSFRAAKRAAALHFGPTALVAVLP